MGSEMCIRDSFRTYLCLHWSSVGDVSVLERKWGIPLVILAVLISLSRLYVGVHYPTDVLGGAVVGAFAAWGAVRIVKRREMKGRREG